MVSAASAASGAAHVSAVGAGPLYIHTCTQTRAVALQERAAPFRVAAAYAPLPTAAKAIGSLYGSVRSRALLPQIYSASTSSIGHYRLFRRPRRFSAIGTRREMSHEPL